MTPQTLFDKLRDSHAVHVEKDRMRRVLAQAFRTEDIRQAGTKKVGTSETRDAVVAVL